MPWNNPVADVGIEVIRIPQPVIPVDLNGNAIGGTQANPAVVQLGGLGNTVTVGQFHNADNQQLPTGTTFGLLTGGVTQLINALGNLDRLREAGIDGVGAVGIQAGAASLAQAVLTTASTSIIAGGGAIIVNPANMLGMALFNVVGVDSGTSKLEYAVITSLPSANAVTLTPINGSPTSPSWQFTHSGTYNLSCFIFNQERDANGELDIPRGQGEAVAVPMLSLSTGQGATNPVNYVRERGVQGLGLSAGIAIASGASAGSLAFTLASSPTGLQAGMALYLMGGGGYERVLTALSYTPGSASIVLDSATPIQGTARTTAQYATFAAGGPVGAAFFPEGEGGEFQAGYDLTAVNGPPGRFFQVATQDAAPVANSPLEAVGILNSAGTLDRQRGNLDNLTLITAVGTITTQVSPDQTNYNGRGVKVFVNMTQAASGSVTFAIQAKDPVSGLYVTLLSSAPITTNGLTMYTIYPGIAPTANLSASDVLPRTWRVQAFANNTNPTTFTVSASIII